VQARVRDPLWQLHWHANLEPVGGGVYAAASTLHLPLDPLPGDWWLIVFIHTDAELSGEKTLRFRPQPVPLQELGERVRDGVRLHIPRAFVSGLAEGDPVAGMQMWRGPQGEVGLWWVPGPDEPLAQDTAQVAVDATLTADIAVDILEVEAVEWHGLSGFRFSERWPTGPAETLVVRGPDHWLYVLRVQAHERDRIAPLLWDIQASFRVEEP